MDFKPVDQGCRGVAAGGRTSWDMDGAASLQTGALESLEVGAGGSPRHTAIFHTPTVWLQQAWRVPTLSSPPGPQDKPTPLLWGEADGLQALPLSGLASCRTRKAIRPLVLVHLCSEPLLVPREQERNHLEARRKVILQGWGWGC